MKQGLDRLRENKLAVAGCAALVAVLTILGIWTNDTANRTTKIERTVNTEVVQALCNQPFTSACLRRAVNIVKTCQADPECARLLASGPDISSSQADREFRVENPNSYETSNSSRGIRNGGEESGPDPGGAGGSPPDSDGKGGGGKQPGGGGEAADPPASAPAAEAAPEESGPPGKGKGPDGEGPPASGAQGLVPSAVESVEGIVNCVGKLDLDCTVREVGVPGLGPR